MTTAITLEPGFVFSQHSLNTYLRCPRRFMLRYVDRAPWPMPEGDQPELHQRHLARGRTLHHWLHRLHLGLDVGPLVRACGDPDLQAWWQAARAYDLGGLLDSPVRDAELSVVVPLGPYGLYARYDYVAFGTPETGDAGQAVIVDWKTLESRPSSRTLRDRVQTRVYLYTIVAAGPALAGVPIDPGGARMVYWFANFPEETEEVVYSSAWYERDRTSLVQLAREIAQRPRADFSCTDDLRQCVSCVYRRLCDREAGGPPPSGQVPAANDWLDEDIDFGLELQQVQELDY